MIASRSAGVREIKKLGLTLNDSLTGYLDRQGFRQEASCRSLVNNLLRGIRVQDGIFLMR